MLSVSSLIGSRRVLEQEWGTEFSFGGGFENHFFIGSWTGIGHLTFKQ